jgi:hypothetical protein
MPLLLLWHPRVQTNTDAATVYFDLQPITVEVFEASDAATVYLDLQASAIYLQVDFLLEIAGITKRWTVGKVGTRWQTFDSVLRWAILKTRRMMWRF